MPGQKPRWSSRKIIMTIEEFISKSVGEWISMRSGHSLAFKEFENIHSTIHISSLKIDSLEVLGFANENGIAPNTIVSPFKISWKTESDWDISSKNETESSSSLLIPIPFSSTEGEIIRSQGYTEKIIAISKYIFLPDGTLSLSTEYDQAKTEERIWFVSNNVRCRTSVVKTSKSLAILQTSYASEIRKITII